MKPIAQGIAIAAIALSFALLSGGIQPASAACNDEVLEMQAQLEQIKDAATKQAVKEHLDEATKAASVQDEVQCTEALHKAQEKAKH